MAQYRRGLKVKVRHTMIPMEDATTIRELIDQAIKVDNRLYQAERADRSTRKPVQANRAPQQVSKPWYGGPEPMDLSGTQESRPKRGKQPWKPRGQGPRRGNSNNGYSNNGYREQRPNQGSLRSGKTFERTPQQQKRFEDGAYMNCGKKGHFARDCK